MQLAQDPHSLVLRAADEHDDRALQDGDIPGAEGRRDLAGAGATHVQQVEAVLYRHLGLDALWGAWGSHVRIIAGSGRMAA
jgi:hypothetical protein